MKIIFKRTVIVAALVLLCSTAFAQQLGETTTRSNIVNDLPVFEQVTVTAIKKINYDTQGRIINTTAVQSRDRQAEIKEDFTYDNKGNIVVYKTVGPDATGSGFFTNERSFKYNQNGDVTYQKIITSFSKDNSYNGQKEYSYEYEKNGNLTSIRIVQSGNSAALNYYPSANMLFAYKYDENGNAIYAVDNCGRKWTSGDKESIHIKAWKPSTNITYLFEDDFRLLWGTITGVTNIFTTCKDKDGNLLVGEMDERFDLHKAYRIFDNEGKLIQLRGRYEAVKYFYNDKELLERLVIELGNGLDSISYEFKYEFDANGRIIKEIEYRIRPM